MVWLVGGVAAVHSLPDYIGTGQFILQI